MAADEPGTIVKQFPVADVLRLLDQVEASFETEIFGGLKWKDTLEDSDFLAMAIEESSFPLRIALCRAWKDSLREYASKLEDGELAARGSKGLVRSLRSMIGVVDDIERISSNEHCPDAHSRDIVRECRNGLAERFNNAISEVRILLNYAAGADVPANVVSLDDPDAAIAEPATSCGDSRLVESKTLTDEIVLALAEKESADQTLVSADQLGKFAKIGGKVIRTALRKADCKPSIKSTGKGNPHQWKYCDAINVLRAVKSGRLRSFIWPDSADELVPQKDSNKIPARK